MARSKVGSTAGEMLGNLKSRLGFAHSESDEEEYAQYSAEYDSYDSYDDYSDYGDEYAPRYGEDDDFDSPYADNIEPSMTGGFRAITTRSGRFGRPDSTPNLVSIEDVREHSKSLLNGTGSSSSRSSRFSSSRSSSSRNFVESSGPAPSSPAYNASKRESDRRSEGLNSLFESTSPRQERYTSSSVLDDTRGLTVIKPLSYNDVEGMARALKAGDAVVMAMADTPEELFKRILDFSFGVASALEAGVDCVEPKVYVIAANPQLTQSEKDRLKAQGVL